MAQRSPCGGVRCARRGDAPRRLGRIAHVIRAVLLTVAARALSVPLVVAVPSLLRFSSPPFRFPRIFFSPTSPGSQRQTWPTSLCGWRKSRKSTPRRHGTPTACGWCGSTCPWASSGSLFSPPCFGRSGRVGEFARQGETRRPGEGSGEGGANMGDRVFWVYGVGGGGAG